MDLLHSDTLHQEFEWHYVTACPLQIEEHYLLQMSSYFVVERVACPLFPAVIVPCGSNHE